MFQRNLLSDGDVEPLADSVFTVLEKVGVLCQNRQMLLAMENMGAKVDYASQVATFPRKMVEEFINRLRKESPETEDNGHRKFRTPSLPSFRNCQKEARK